MSKVFHNHQIQVRDSLKIWLPKIAQNVKETICLF